MTKRKRKQILTWYMGCL